MRQAVHTELFAVRMHPALAAAIRERAEARHMSPSELARMALRRYVVEEAA